jgi:hypothetical protein
MTPRSTPRSVAEYAKQFADEMGVSAGYARQYMNRRFTKQQLEELDARLRARASMAELEAARSLTEKDIEWLADDDDPEAGLDFLIGHRSHQILNYGGL